MSATTPQKMQEVSLRIKYESFAKLTTELSMANNFKEVAKALQLNLKYIFDFTHFRFLVFYKTEQLTFEIGRQSADFVEEPLEITELERAVMSRNMTLLLDENELKEQENSIHPFFTISTKHLCLYPLRIREDQYMLICAANKENKGLVESDYRFLRQMGEYLFSKLSQLVLTEQLEKMVSKRTEQLNSANHELSTLFYRASHDFNAPLTSLQGLLHLCKLQIDNPIELAPLLDYTKQVIDRTQRMLLKLKIISEIETLIQNPESINLHGFVFALKEKFRDAATSKNIRLIGKVITDAEISFSTEILRTLMENLVENSIHYHRSIPDPFVHITITCFEANLKIKIEDNGQGIPENKLPSIFEMYSRANENSRGNGLGLYVVKKVVEKLNGTIQARSKVNEGSLFEINIPLAQLSS